MVLLFCAGECPPFPRHPIPDSLPLGKRPVLSDGPDKYGGIVVEWLAVGVDVIGHISRSSKVCILCEK